MEARGGAEGGISGSVRVVLAGVTVKGSRASGRLGASGRLRLEAGFLAGRATKPRETLLSSQLDRTISVAQAQTLSNPYM